MDGTDNRQIARDSLFVLADLRVDGLDGEHRIKVRNLSSGGMMGEGPVRVTVEARGFKLEDPVRAFKAKATGTLRITIRPSVPGTGPAEFQLKMDLRKPGL